MDLRHVSLGLGLALLLVPPVDAQVMRLEITSREVAADGRPFGTAGPYEILRGRVRGEVDPADRHNAIIQDLRLADTNARGRAEYVATFMLAKPIDMARASGVLMYTVVNRGHGRAEPSPDGHVTLVSGWQGDLASAADLQTVTVPMARHPDGAPVTGPVLARFFNVPARTTTLPIHIGSIPGAVPYPPASMGASNGRLVSISSEDAEGRQDGVTEVPRTDWAFADCRSMPFPGVPDPARVCARHGFEPARLYELTYVAKDPLVLGVGLAATRDVIAFFRGAAADSQGAANPLAGRIRHVVAVGDSQSGNLLRTFVHLGFNEDLQGHVVMDGVFPRIAARQTPINLRFAAPGGAATLYEPGSEPVLWWGRYDDAVRGLGIGSLLDRCGASRTCPKVIEAFGSAEFWGLRMSPDLVGTDATSDIALPASVRRYYYPGTTHGGGRGGFAVAGPPPPPGCSLPANPNPQTDTTRALTAALVDWVVRGTEPPASRYPRLAEGELASATGRAIGFPDIPGVTAPDGLVNPVLDYDFGPEFVARDLSGVMSRQPPLIRRVVPTLVPVVDADGNETSGVPSVLHQAPLGTYLGWNVVHLGFFGGQGCGFAGGYVPFAKTRAERETRHDPRLSLEERYGTRDGYVCVVRRAAERAVADRFLLRLDADRLLAEAASSDVLPEGSASGEAARAVADRLCANEAR